MGKTKSKFDRVLSSWDVLVLAFGAMIGWGWVVSTGVWIRQGGVLGAALGFAIGGLMIVFIGLTYAELTSAMPQCGGEHVFSYKALGPMGSFICTWAIILGYVSVVCFEAVALPTIITYLYPNFLRGYMYTIGGYDVYASWVAVAVITSASITYINIKGAKTAAKLQTLFTCIIGGAGIVLIIAAAIKGDTSNLSNQMFVGASSEISMKNVFRVAMFTPFFFIGFDVIPQAAEEINVPLKKIGRILILSILLAVTFYALVIIAVGLALNASEIAASATDDSALVTADAMAKLFNTNVMAKVLIVGGMCGIVTSWNSFLIGGSRAIYSMAEAYMIPRFFAKLHKEHKTPINALILIGLLSVAAPFFGGKMLIWIMDAGNLGCTLAYFMVSISFVKLRKKAPEMPRPYKVKHYKFVGAVAICMSGLMISMYLIPNSGATLSFQEWIIAAGWSIMGVGFCMFGKLRYKEKFATHIDVLVEMDDCNDDDEDIDDNNDKPNKPNNNKVKKNKPRIEVNQTL